MGALFAQIPWAVVLIVLPLTGAIACLAWPRAATPLGLITQCALLISVVGLTWQLMHTGAYRYAVGGWEAPLGIALYADGLSLLMLSMSALVGFAVSVYSTAYFEQHRLIQFWPLCLFLLAALNALFLSADIFNLYVTLEMMGLAAVALVALSTEKSVLSVAMRYLLATLLGSLFYLLGVALLYHGFSSVDIPLLAERVQANATLWTAMALIIAGLALKTALFPFHFWLPPAHAGAPAPVSALLSALVVAATFYILLRLWLTIFAPLGAGVADLLALLGGLAVLWGSVQALRQRRLKMLVAYSTVAQIGYLFLAFTLAEKSDGAVWRAVVYLVFSHALAKAAMFLAAGNLLRFGAHDRIADLDRVVQRLPLSALAFALAGVSIMGLPPSGGFIGKWLLLQAALAQGRWELVALIVVGGLLAGAYVFKVLGYAFTQADAPHVPGTVPALMQWTALLLAFSAIVLGFTAVPFLSLLSIGNAFLPAEVLP